MRPVLTLCLCLVEVSFVAASGAPKALSKSPDELLKEADRLAWIKNWTRAEPLFRAAGAGYHKRGDRRNELYAHIGRLRGELPSLPLLVVSNELGDDLESPLVQGDPRLRLRCLTVKGDVDMDVDTDLATDDWEQARTVAEQLRDRQWVSRANGELGILAFLRGDPSQALRLVYGALVSAKASRDLGAEIRYLTVLGRGMAEVGNTEHGLKLIDQAIALVAGEPELKDPLLQWSNKADVLEIMGRTSDAEKLIRTAIDVAQRDGAEGYDAALSISLAKVYMDRGEFKSAVPILAGAKRRAKQVDGMRLVSEADLALSKCYEMIGNLNLARDASAEGVRISQRLGDKSQLPPLLGQLAKMEATMGHVASAEHIYERGEDVIAGLLVSSSSPSAKASLVGTLSQVYLGHFSLEAYQRHNAARAYTVIEEVRGRSTADTLRSRHNATVTPAERRIESAISRLQFRLMQTSNRQARRSLLDQIFSQEEALGPEQTKTQVAQPFGPPASLRTVQQSLNSDEAIIEYVLDDPRSSALVVTHATVQVTGLAARPKIESLASQLLGGVSHGGDAKSSRAFLFDAILAPLRLPSTVRAVIVMPDGALNDIPFEILRHGDDMLLKHVSVSYAPSSTVLALLRGRPHSPSRSLLAVSGGSGKKVPTELAAITTRGVYDVDFQKLPPLTAADDEVADVADALHERAIVLRGSQANEANFKSLHLSDYQVIHFAVHGVTSARYPDRSALVLRPSPNGTEDGLLQAREIRQLRLNAELVTLSACNSSLGRIKGEEGVDNLVQAFLVAGAKSVVATLWAVNDEFTREFMARFYKELAGGLTVADALRQTKLGVIHDYGSRQASLWAGFVVYGDGLRKIQ